MTTAKKLLCGHLFHVHCLRSWRERQHTCPTCRSPIAPPDNGRAPSARQHEAQLGVSLVSFLLLFHFLFWIFLLNHFYQWVLQLANSFYVVPNLVWGKIAAGVGAPGPEGVTSKNVNRRPTKLEAYMNWCPTKQAIFVECCNIFTTRFSFKSEIKAVQVLDSYMMWHVHALQIPCKCRDVA